MEKKNYAVTIVCYVFTIAIFLAILIIGKSLGSLATSSGMMATAMYVVAPATVLASSIFLGAKKQPNLWIYIVSTVIVFLLLNRAVYVYWNFEIRDIYNFAYMIIPLALGMIIGLIVRHTSEKKLKS